MLTVLNRKELISTFDIQIQAEVRNILAQNGIEYTYKTVNRRKSSPFFTGGTRVSTGTYGENLSLMNEYTIFVVKDDYDKAKYLIREIS